MTLDFERAKSRLDNIQAIEPLLSALRTLSMSSWQMALNNLAKIEQYRKSFDPILIQILPNIQGKRTLRMEKSQQKPNLAEAIIMIIGTERGLCGQFNKVLAENAVAWIQNQDFSSYQIWAIGSRLIRDLERMNMNISLRKTFSTSYINSYQSSYQFTQNLLTQFESYSFDHLIILFNQSNKGQYQFSTFHLLPHEIHPPANTQQEIEKYWPPAIIETDPLRIYHQIITHHLAANFYKVLLESAVAEHSSRYNLMQEARDNAEEIIEELDQIINIERKKQITQEMQELATGAGLLDNN